MSKTDKTMDAVLGSLTGFDEIAIAQRTGKPIIDLMQADKLHGVRCLIGIDKMRAEGNEGPKAYAAAYKDAMGLTMTEVTEYFTAPEPDDELGDEDPKD